MLLDEKVAHRVIGHHQKLMDAGKLPSHEQLDRWISNFRSRFGPDRLRALDGEALLTELHAQGSKESLTYWLEFKNDDEFPGTIFEVSPVAAL